MQALEVAWLRWLFVAIVAGLALTLALFLGFYSAARRRPSGDPEGPPPFGPEGPQGPEGQDGLKGRAEGQGEELEEYAAGIQVGRRPIPILLVLLYVGVGIAVIAYVLYIWRAGLAY